MVEQPIALTEGSRLQEQEDTLRRDAVRVRVAADSMHQLETRRERAEGATPVRCLHTLALEHGTDLRCDIELQRVGRSVDEKCPIDVRLRRALTPAEGSEDDQRCVRCAVLRKGSSELRPLRSRPLS